MIDRTIPEPDPKHNPIDDLRAVLLAENKNYNTTMDTARCDAAETLVKECDEDSEDWALAVSILQQLSAGLFDGGVANVTRVRAARILLEHVDL